jgi:hypothetical protein
MCLIPLGVLALLALSALSPAEAETASERDTHVLDRQEPGMLWQAALRPTEGTARFLSIMASRERAVLFDLERVACEDSDPNVRHFAEFAKQSSQLAEE